ncbi:hypothetical protein ACM66B_005595 [Microbotryomycetes sp. NB124-2]
MRDLDCKWTAPPKNAHYTSGENELQAAQAEVARLRALVDLLMMRLSEVDDTASAYGVSLGTSSSASSGHGVTATSPSTLLPSPRSAAPPQHQFPLPTVGIPGLSFLQGYTFPTAPVRSSTSSPDDSMDGSSRSDSEEWQTAAGAFTSSSDWTAATFSATAASTNAQPGDIYIGTSAAGTTSAASSSINAATAMVNHEVAATQDPSTTSSYGSSGLAQYHLF